MLTVKEAAVPDPRPEGDATRGTTQLARRAPRSDGLRNRAGILEAAVQLTRTGVQDVSMDAVARRAGVAVGTVYRHWPSKQDLLRSVLLSRLGDVAQDAETAATLYDFLNLVTDRCVADPALLALLDDGGAGDLFGGAGTDQVTVDAVQERRELRDRLNTALAGLIDRARADGRLQLDLQPGDVRVYLIGLRAALQSQDPDAWRRYRDVYLAGVDAHASPG